MNFPLLSLELRKNRLSAASVAAAFLVTLPVSRLVAGTTGMEPARALEAILLGWMILGSPLAAALIASSAGAQTASRDDREAEALLPVSPLRRAGASIAASALLFAAVTALLVATAWAFGALAPQLLARNPALNWGRPFWMDSSISPIFVFALADALLSCWLMSYLLGHGVAGGLLGLLLTGAALFVAAVAGGMQLGHGEWGVSVLAMFSWLGAGTLAAKLTAAAYAAAWRERATRLGVSGAAALAAMILFGPVSGAVVVRRTYLALGAQVAHADRAAVYQYQSFQDQFPRGSRALAAAGEGAILKTVSGAILLADARGVRSIVPEKNTGLSELLLEPYKTWIHGTWRDEKGVLWIERYVSPNTELWRVAGATAERKVMTDRGSFTMIGGGPVKHAYPGSDRRLRVAAADDYFLHGDKAAWYEGYARYLSRRERELATARPACSGKCLEAGGRRWKLPGVALSPGAVYPDDIGGRRAYLLPVRTRKGQEVALCRADGSTEIAWPYEDFMYHGLPDGTLFAFGADETLWAIGPDGRVAPPLSYALLASKLPQPRGRRPALMRRAEGKSWLVWGGWLSVLDAGGRTIFSRSLPAGVESAVPLKDGFLITTKRSAWFSDWTGALRRVENPR